MRVEHHQNEPKKSQDQLCKIRGRNKGDFGYKLLPDVVTSMILLLIISSSEAVTSSVITGAGLVLCSKSKSTSRALFFGLFVAVIFQQDKLYTNLATESNIAFYSLLVWKNMAGYLSLHCPVFWI